jgi:hypothetical protein
MLASVSLENARTLLDQEHQDVEALLGQLTAEEMNRPDTIKHGLFWGQQWSFKDLLAHLTTYETLAVEAYQAWTQGERHWSLDKVETSEGSEEIHNDGVASRRDLTLDEMIQQWTNQKDILMNTLAALDETQWRSTALFATTAQEPYDLGGVFEAIIAPVTRRPIYRHLPVHIPDYAEYLNQLRVTAAQ